MNRRYPAALAVAAAALLAVGTYFRPKTEKAGHAPAPQTAGPTAASPVSRSSEMRQISDFLAERARRTAQHLAWVPSAQATGLQWTTGQVVTISKDETVPLQTVALAETTLTPVRMSPEERLQQGGWVVLAAMNPDGQLISSSGLLGGTASVTCGNRQLRKLLFNIPLDEAWAGGGVFDVSGLALGLVVHCGTGWTALTSDSVQQLLEGQLGPDAITWQEFGVRIGTASDAERKQLRIRESAGLFVTEVREASRAANMGLLPGDVLVRSGEQLLAEAEDVLAIGDRLTIIRAGRTLTLDAHPDFAVGGIDGSTLTHVEPESRIAKAGLRPGDRVLQPSLLNSKGSAWIIYRRGNRLAGAMLP